MWLILLWENALDGNTLLSSLINLMGLVNDDIVILNNVVGKATLDAS